MESMLGRARVEDGHGVGGNVVVGGDTAERRRPQRARANVVAHKPTPGKALGGSVNETPSVTRSVGSERASAVSTP